MGQIAKEQDEMTEQEKNASERNLPNRGGAVSDEDLDKASGDSDDKPTGQDHSLENYEETMPDEGVGAVQDSSTIKDGIAHIEEE